MWINKIKLPLALVIIIGFIVIGLGFVAYWAIYPNNSPYWTGFGIYDENINGPRAKTLWDWLGLLIIPITISLLAWIFKEVEKQKSKEIEEDRAQNEQLDSYIKIMTELLINSKEDILSLRIKSIARTRTILALSNLNVSRKCQVLQFIFESNLILKSPQINLNGANFRKAILDGIVLKNADLRGVYFNSASLKNSNLTETDFTCCNFTGANLTNSVLENTNLSYTDLTKAKLNNMDLTSVNFDGANLTKANLYGSRIKREQLNNINKKEGIKITKSKIV